MRYSAIMFDLDGTLLPMDTEAFARAYFYELSKVLAPFGLTKEALFKPFWAATTAMMGNDGRCLNADVFWQTFTALTGISRDQVEPLCDAFYSEGFHLARTATRDNPLAVEAVRAAREKADKVILEPKAAYTKRLISDVPKIHEEWDLSTVDLLNA